MYRIRVFTAFDDRAEQVKIFGVELSSFKKKNIELINKYE